LTDKNIYSTMSPVIVGTRYISSVTPNQICVALLNDHSELGDDFVAQIKRDSVGEGLRPSRIPLLLQRW
jgi:hypothetical protein